MSRCWKVAAIRPTFVLLPCLVGAVALLVVPPTSAQGKTQRIGKELAAKATETVKAIDAAEKQLDKVMNRYTKMLSEKNLKDRRKAHKATSEELRKLQGASKAVRERNRKMEREAGKLFAEWQKGLDAIQDQELRSLSRKRMTDSQQSYERIVEAGGNAATQYEAFVSTLTNQLKYLELDLSREAVAKLKSSKQDLRGEANELRARVDALKADIRRYTASLK
jgi:hypothetical protein